MFEQRFRFFHGFFLFECFPENQEKVENNQRRKVDIKLKLVRKCKYEITDKKENNTENDPKGQRFGRVLAER
jgi:hypothetical protein